MGRRSFADYDRLRREHPDSPAVHFLDFVPKYVASTTLTEVGWPGTTVLGDVSTTVEFEQNSPGCGPSQERKSSYSAARPVRWLLAHKQYDELTITVLPIIVGSGVPLFEDMQLSTGRPAMRADIGTRMASGALELPYPFA